jgi:hypothetical protein
MAVGEVGLAEEGLVELPTLVVVTGPIHSDRAEELARVVVGGVVSGKPGQRVGDLLTVDGGVVTLDGAFSDGDV